jgi:hypothetical protein
MTTHYKIFIFMIVLAFLFLCGCIDMRGLGPFDSSPSLPATTFSGPGSTSAAITPPPGGLSSHNVSEVYLATQREDLRNFTMNSSDYYEAHYIPLETARLQATVLLADTFYNNVFGAVTPDYEGAWVNPDPKIIYDGDTGKRSMYLYCAMSRKSPCLASSGAVASKVRGDIGGGAAIGSDTSDEYQIEKAQEYIDDHLPSANLSSVRFVGTCWGEVLRITFTDQNMTQEHIDLRYGYPKAQKRCAQDMDITTMSKQDMDDNISEWEIAERSFRLVLNESELQGVNLSEPFTHANDKKMRQAFRTAGWYNGPP